MTRRFALMFAALTSAAPAFAQDAKPLHLFQDEREYFNEIADEVCEGELSRWEELVTRGNTIDAFSPQAAVALGWIMTNEDCRGNPITDDMERVQYRLNLHAAAHGYPIAMWNLAHMLIIGDGTDPDPSRGARLAIKAAEAGYYPAAANLAEQLSTGEYMPRNLKLAVRLIEFAEENGVSGEALRNAKQAYRDALWE